MIKMSTIVGLVAATMATTPVWSAEKPAPKGAAATAKAVEPGPRFASTAKPGATHGEKIFVEYCAVCHGLHGKGDGPRSAFFGDVQYIPDLSTSGFLDGRDDEIRASIRDGLNRQDEPAIVMPQFKYILGATDIDSVVAYVKTLAPPEAKKKKK